MPTVDASKIDQATNFGVALGLFRRGFRAHYHINMVKAYIDVTGTKVHVSAGDLENLMGEIWYACTEGVVLAYLHALTLDEEDDAQ